MAVSRSLRDHGCPRDVRLARAASRAAHGAGTSVDVEANEALGVRTWQRGDIRDHLASLVALARDGGYEAPRARLVARESSSVSAAT
jgi:hypothetical protein